jgi:4'-phosphopantetheinyl transferase
MSQGHDSLAWRTAARAPALPDGAVHVWRLHVRDGAGDLNSLRRLLSAEEVNRAARFAFERDRCRFITVHGVLRRILAGYTGSSPESLCFASNSFGKPHLLDRGAAAPRVNFNLSDAGDLALYAIARGAEVGVDVEKVRPIEHLEIAERFFSSREAEALSGLPPDRQLPAFYTCWTRKEAYIKGRGAGLRIPLGEFSVPLSADLEAGKVHSAAGEPECAKWRLYGLDPGEGYVAALAVNRRPGDVVCLDYDPGLHPAGA